MEKITTVITAHAEGKLVIPSIESCLASSALIEAEGVEVEKYIALDRASKDTKTAVLKSDYKSEFKIIELDFGDQGFVRNHMIGLAKGDYMAFLDGDDLWSENWLHLAWLEAQKFDQSAVIYPEFNWFFEGSNNILCQSDDSYDCFSIEALRSVNLWDALCFCPTSVYREIPFSQRKIKEGFAFEDWRWNRQIMEHDILQKVARDTIIFKRRRQGSQGAHAQKRGVIAEPTSSSYFSFYSDDHS